MIAPRFSVYAVDVYKPAVKRGVVFEGGLNKAIVKYLGPHGPDGLLAFVFVLIAAALFKAGVDIWAAIVLVAVVYGIYGVRQTLREGHLERLAEIEVRRKETELATLRARQKAKIGKSKASVKAVPARSGSATTGGGKP